ncbi:dpy-30 motif protein [Cystoisospora suis]|uniref:Dpy-30 motif protein n=1 Tax=Cystoisospora suis TaxID=483139 RepID=A0A2C6L0L0_9APIC|nr:dpy-30 motif protein [Cystoisospora suis]
MAHARSSWTTAFLRKAAHTKAIIVERLSRSPHGRGDEADTGSTLSTMSVEDGARGPGGVLVEAESPFSMTHTSAVEQDWRSPQQQRSRSRAIVPAFGREEPLLSTRLRRASLANEWEGERVTLSGFGREHVTRSKGPSFPPGLLERARPNIAHVFCVQEDVGPSNAGAEGEAGNAEPLTSPPPLSPVPARNMAELDRVALGEKPPKLSVQSLPIRQYLDMMVVPALLPALTVLVNERPEQPVEFLAHWLLENGMKYSAANAPAGGGSAAIASLLGGN